MDKPEALVLAEMIARSTHSTIVIEEVAREFIPFGYEEYDTNWSKRFDNGSTVTIIPLPF